MADYETRRRSYKEKKETGQTIINLKNKYGIKMKRDRQVYWRQKVQRIMKAYQQFKVQYEKKNLLTELRHEYKPQTEVHLSDGEIKLG